MKEEKRINPKSKARLKWFLDFMYMDIDSLSDSEFLKLLIDLRDIVRPYDPDRAVVEIFGGPELIPWLDAPEMPWSHDGYPVMRREIKGCQEHLKNLLKDILHMYYQKTPEDKFSFKISLRITIIESWVYLIASKTEDALTAEFAYALKPFSLENIRRCEREDCERYFLKATKKEKRYCSNKCAWVMASRKRIEVRKRKEE